MGYDGGRITVPWQQMPPGRWNWQGNNPVPALVDPGRLSREQLTRLYIHLTGIDVPLFQQHDMAARRVARLLAERGLSIYTSPPIPPTPATWEAGHHRWVAEAGRPSRPNRGRVNRPEDVITVLVDHNPKKLGSLSRDRFDLYRTGMTVAEFISLGGRSNDLLDDVHHQYIRVDHPS